jgi:hypothetical protein
VPEIQWPLAQIATPTTRAARRIETNSVRPRRLVIVLLRGA